MTISAAKRADALAGIMLLAELFPQAFVVLGIKRKPLKIGIDVDIIGSVNSAIKPHELMLALTSYTHADGYLRSMRPGAARIDLHGNPCGCVAPEAAAKAAEELATRLLKAANRRKQRAADAAAMAAKQPAAAATGPRKLTLADLKYHALARKAG
jgi:sRNA-binding protein